METEPLEAGWLDVEVLLLVASCMLLREVDNLDWSPWAGIRVEESKDGLEECIRFRWFGMS